MAVPAVGAISPASMRTRRRLAGAIRAEQAEDLAVAHREGHVVHRGERAEMLAEPLASIIGA